MDIVWPDASPVWLYWRRAIGADGKVHKVDLDSWRTFPRGYTARSYCGIRVVVGVRARGDARVLSNVTMHERDAVVSCIRCKLMTMRVVDVGSV